MVEKVGIGIIGAGGQGKLHAEMYSLIPEAELKAICDVLEDAAKEVAMRYNIDWYSDYRELLKRKDIDAVSITTPNYLHAPIAIEAAEAGKHIAIEKPLCISLEEADSMLRTVKKTGILDLYCENVCFAPAYTIAKHIVDGKGIGEIFTIRCRTSIDGQVRGNSILIKEQKSNWRTDLDKGGGNLIGHAVHAAGYMEYVLNNERASRVYAEVNCEDGLTAWAPGKLEQIALVTIRFRHGQLGLVDMSALSPGGYNDLVEIYGNRGIIKVDNCWHYPVRVYSEDGYPLEYARSLVWSRVITKGWSFPIPDEKRNHGYWYELKHFTECMLTDQRPKVNFEIGRSALELMIVARKSAETGKPISLP